MASLLSLTLIPACGSGARSDEPGSEVAGGSEGSFSGSGASGGSSGASTGSSLAVGTEGGPTGSGAASSGAGHSSDGSAAGLSGTVGGTSGAGGASGAGGPDGAGGLGGTGGSGTSGGAGGTAGAPGGEVCTRELEGTGIVIEHTGACDAADAPSIAVADPSLPDGWNAAGGAVLVDLDEAGGTVTVVIPLDDDVHDSGVVAIHVSDSGAVTPIAATAGDDGIRIEVSEDGTYTVAEVAPAPLAGCTTTLASGSYYIEEAAQLDALNGVSFIEGGLMIVARDLTHLDALACLRSIGGELAIHSAIELVDTDGLSNLVSVGGVLRAVGNTALESLRLPSLLRVEWATTLSNNPVLAEVDLSSLVELEATLSVDGNGGAAEPTSLDFGSVTHLRGDFVLHSNGGVVDLEGFGSLRRIEGDIDLQSNSSLTNSEFVHLAEVRGALHVSDNATLASFEAPALAELGGSVTLESNEALAEVDLGALGAIAGTLHVFNNGSTAQLTTLDFGSVEHLTGHLEMSFNPRLMDLDGFEALKRVEGDIALQRNDALEDTDGLASLEEVNGIFYVSENGALTSFKVPVLAELGGVITVGGNAAVTLANNGALAEVDFGALTALPGTLMISNNGSMAQHTTLDFGSVEHLAGDFFLFSNPELQSLDGFASLERIDGSLLISGNAALTDLDGLANLTDLGGGLSIDSNIMLPTCEATAFRDGLQEGGWPGSATITNNLEDACSE